MRVAQVIDRVHMAGGAERLQRTFADAIDPGEVALTVITLRESLPEAEAELRDRGVPVASFPAKRFADLGRARAVVDFVRSQRFDLLHAHLARSTVLAGFAGRATGTPLVATLHNTERDSRVGPVLRIAEHWVLRRAAERVIAVGWETARAHRRTLGARTIDVIPNAVVELPPLPARDRAEVRRELGVPDDAPLLISVGRLVPQKAVADLVRAFAQLPNRAPAPHLWIVGRGRQEASLAQQIERLGLGARAKLLGLRFDVPRLLGASDLYVSSSHWEGLPVAMLEAMGAGLPVIATRVGDVPRVIDEGCGVLVPARDPAALAHTISALLADPVRRQRLGAAGRARVSTHFGAEAWARRHTALYAEVARSHRSPWGQPQEETQCAS